MTEKPRSDEQIPQYRIPAASQEASSLTVYRSVLPVEETIKMFGMLQDYVGQFLKERSLDSIGAPLALDGLRMMLHLPRSITTIKEKNPDIRNTSHARKKIVERLRLNEPQAFEPVQAKARLGTMLRVSNVSHAVLLFRDTVSVGEQRCIYESLGDEPLGKKHPLIPFRSMPILSKPDAIMLNNGLTTVAPHIEVALGPIQFELLGPTE